MTGSRRKDTGQDFGELQAGNTTLDALSPLHLTFIFMFSGAERCDA